MQNLSLFPNKHLLTLAFWLGILSLLSIVVCAVFDFSLAYAVAIPSLTICLWLFLNNPLKLLFTLIVVRMSMDYFGETISFSLTNTLSLTLSQIIGVLVFMLGILFFATRTRHLSPLSHTRPLLIVLAWGTLTLLFSIDTNTTIKELLRVFDILALSAIAFLEIKTHKDFKSLLETFFIASFFPVLIGIYQFFFRIGFQDATVSIPRIYGTFSHPNVFSLYLFSMIAIGTLYFFLFADTQNQKRGVLALVGLYTLMLFITYTRIAWIALFIFLLILALIRFRLLILPLLLLPFFLYALVPPLQERINNSFQDSPDSSIVWRKNLWADTVNKTFSDSKSISGYGMNTFPVVSESLRGIRLGSNDPHNDFVKFFVEGGVIGLGAYVLYVLTLLVTLGKNMFAKNLHPQASLVFLILFALGSSLIFSSLSDNIFKNTPVQWMFWILLGAAFQVFSYQTKEKF
jgi:putative inorganic carbon (HCO3(-)) transporter